MRVTYEINCINEGNDDGQKVIVSNTPRSVYGEIDLLIEGAIYTVDANELIKAAEGCIS